MTSERSGGRLRLSDLQRSHPGDATLQNLLRSLSAQMDTCSRLTIFEYEAGSEGHDDCATAFRDIADAERQSFRTLLACLQQYLDELPVADPARQYQATQESRR